MKRDPDYRTDNKMVVRNDFIYADHPIGMSIHAMRLLRIAITQCRKNDNEFFMYEFKVSDLADMIGCSRDNLYRVADEITDQLLRVILKTNKLENIKSSGKKHVVFDVCEYDKGIIRLQIHQQMKDLLLNLSPKFGNFTRVPLAPMLLMQSKYAMRIFELICQQMMSLFPYADHATEIEVSLDDLRLVTDTVKQKTYDKISNFKNKVFLPSIADIEKAAEWKIICTDIKRSRRIVGFNLQIWSASGYAYLEYCKKTGKIPVEKNDDIPGQMSLFDL